MQELLALAEQADGADIPDGMKLPEELKRRQDRIAAMQEAKTKIQGRAQARFEREQAEYQAKLAQIQARAEQTGKRPGGRPLKPPEPGARAQDQINLTDEESRIMPVAGGGFEQCYNRPGSGRYGQHAGARAPGDASVQRQGKQVLPMLEQLAQLPGSLGRVDSLIADCGFCSDKNIAACEAAGVKPYMAVARQDHHPHWSERFAQPAPCPHDATALQRMAHKLSSPAGRAVYALRKQTVEPVFGIIKSVMGFRQFLLRGKDKVSGEWRLVCLAWNLKRMAVLRHKSVPCA